MSWLTLVLSLPTENAAARMRAWRALKAAGAAVLRDGVYLTPALDACRASLRAIADDVRSSGGSAQLLAAEAEDDAAFAALFDRSADYAALLAEVARIRKDFDGNDPAATQKQLRRLRKTLGQVAGIDFFPGEALRQVDAALGDLETRVERALSPNEPQARQAELPRLDAAGFRKRRWATRARPKVDRLASAWLIRRCIDPKASFVWLAKPADCPPDALGFDFDGAPFTHVGHRVTFETLLDCFGLDEPALARIGALVHHLDVGGIAPPEAPGLAQILAGLRETIPDDDRLLKAAGTVFDALHTAFTQDIPDE